MKIAVVVQGRFHAFDLAKALIRHGEDVTVFTNYPKWVARRFGLPDERVRSFSAHGVLARAASRFEGMTGAQPEWWLNPLFGRWAAREIDKERWDIVHGWSGVSEEILRGNRGSASTHFIMRGSAHIRTQQRLLDEESARAGVHVPGPSEWIVAREEREYRLADRVVVLSSFARDSFIAEGVPADRLRLVPLGVETAAFRASPEEIDLRCRRILSGEPLTALFVGALSLQKGLWDSLALARALAPRMRFRFVGPVSPEAQGLATELKKVADVVPKQPQAQLRPWYSGSDLFFFPTIQDGFAVVLAQASRNALPVLTTTNCSGPDLLREGKTGWVLPIRSPEAFAERLVWCDENRPALAAMVRHLATEHTFRNWDDVAADFVRMSKSEIAGRVIVNG